MGHRIAYANAWVLRVDGAHRRLASYAALPIALVAILVAMLGGGKIYQLLGAGLASNPVLDRSVLYICIMAPFYAVAAGMLLYERRGKIDPNIGPLGGGLGGLGLGLAGFGLAVGLSALAGAIARGAPPAPLDHRLAGVAIGLVLIGFQAFGEEFFFRGWLQPVLAARLGPWIGIVSTSALFAVAHGLVGHIGVIALFNDLLASMVFGLLAFRSGGLAAPFAAHFAWNWAEQSIAGLTPNPGVDPLGSLFDLDLVGSPWLGGGPDELNGALCATVALVLMCGAVLAWRPASKPA